MSRQSVKSVFSNYAIIIDEVHHLRKSKEQNDYEVIHNFLHTIENIKVVLMSGTPMADIPSEIADIMNLILPINKQMPTGAMFDSTFLIQETPLIYRINPANVNILKNFFKGRVSYLKAIQANVIVKYIGEKLGSLRILNVEPDLLAIDTVQNNSYLNAFRLDTAKISSKTIKNDEQDEQDDEAAGTGLYFNSQQASVAVFPDGSYGSEGFKRYITETKSSNALASIVGNTKQNFAEFTIKSKVMDADGNKIPSLREYLTQNGNTNASKLTQLSKISLKFASIIDKLLSNIEAPDGQKKSSFIYCNWVKGSGCILFAKILELFGFKKATGGEKTKGLRYALLTSAVCTDNQITNYIDTFNQPENKYGEIINVIIGSKIIGEGISLKNIQDVHILTPHWNFTVTEQALSRAIRAFAHSVLEAIVKQVVVSVYLHVSIPSIQTGTTVEPDLAQSIDLIMYEKSEHKDISMKRVEFVIKQSAFDCALNYGRNYRQPIFSEDGQQLNLRDCDYEDCNYRCDGITQVDENNIDLSTYRLYYQKERINYLISQLKQVFQIYFTISYKELLARYNVYTEYELLSALNKLLYDNIPIYNKYGFLSYVVQKNNYFFLVNDLGMDVNLLQAYYTKFPSIHSNVHFKDIVSTDSNINYPKLVGKLCKLSPLPNMLVAQQNIQNNQRISILKKIPIELQELLLELSYVAHNKNIQKNKFIQTWLVNIYKPYILPVKYKGTVINVSFLQHDSNQYRYYDNASKSWKNADTALAKICAATLQKLYDYMEKSPYDYYGIVSFDKFYLKNTTIKSAQVKGRDCKTMPIWELYNIIIKLNLSLTMRDGDNIISYPSRGEIINTLVANKDIREIEKNTSQKINKLSNNILQTLYWYVTNRIQKPRLCEDIFSALDSGTKPYILGYYLTPKILKPQPAQPKTSKAPKTPKATKEKK